MWFGKNESEVVGTGKHLISGRAWSHPWYENAALLQSVNGGKSYQWNLEMIDSIFE